MLEDETPSLRMRSGKAAFLTAWLGEITVRKEGLLCLICQRYGILL